MGFGIYHFFKMLGGIKPERRKLSNYLGPLILFIPGIFSEKGTNSKYKFFVFVTISAIMVYLLINLVSVYGKPPYMQQ